MLKQIIVIVAVGSVLFWFWSIRPESSRTLKYLLGGCEFEQCKTTLWVERTTRSGNFLGQLEFEPAWSMDVIGEFPDYLSCAVARGARAVAIEERLRKEGIGVETQTAHHGKPLPNAGSVSVIVDNRSKMVTTHTFFCGYRSLVPDRRDSPDLFP